MAYTTVNKSSSFMNPKLYTGNSSARTISGVGFQPDFTWLKVRDGATAHFLFDVLRGPLYRIQSNSTNTSVSAANTLTAWNSDGFALGTENDTNNNSYSYASWNWKANGAGSSNTAGSINSTVSVNTTAGFSICKWTGSGANATIGHGLGAVPKMIIVKNTSTTDSWMVYHVGSGSNAYLHLETTNAALSPSTAQFQATTPTSSLFYVGTADGTNKSSSTMIAYCFADIQGYSKFGSYVGLGGTNYPFIYTGFKPAFVMAKRTNSTSNWVMYDNKRQYNNIEGQYNPQRPRLASNLSAAESSFTSDNGVDLLSNGFVVRDNSDDAYTINISGSTYIYMAFGQSIVGSNNIPATAR